jgi:hypothetical protein
MGSVVRITETLGVDQKRSVNQVRDKFKNLLPFCIYMYLLVTLPSSGDPCCYCTVRIP